MLIQNSLFAVSQVASTDEMRANLCAVHVSRQGDKVQVQATEGHIALRVVAPETPGDAFPLTEGFDPSKTEKLSVSVPTADWNAVGKAIPKKSGSRTLPPVLAHAALSENSINGSIPIFTNDLSSTRRFDPKRGSDVAHFPDLDQVIPPVSEEDRVFSFDAKLMAKLLKAISDTIGENGSAGCGRRAGGQAPCQVILRVPSDPCRPARIDASNCEGFEAIGVIMPMRM